jgi:hypothetical protein
VDELLWLDWVRAELARRRLPPEYCRRLLVELSDHLQTYKEDRSMDAIDHGSVSRRLGEPAAIAEAARVEFRKARFALRHPLVTFIFGPIVCLLLFNAAELLGIWAFLESMAWAVGSNWDDGRFAWFDPVLPAAVYLLAIVPIAAASAWICWLALRSDCARRWPAVACLILATLSAFYFSEVVMPGGSRGALHGIKVTRPSPQERAGKHTVIFGAGFVRHPSALQWLQIATPLSICGVAMFWHTRRREWTVASPCPH